MNNKNTFENNQPREHLVMSSCWVALRLTQPTTLVIPIVINTFRFNIGSRGIWNVIVTIAIIHQMLLWPYHKGFAFFFIEKYPFSPASREYSLN